MQGSDIADLRSRGGGSAPALSEGQAGLLALGGTIGAGLFLSIGDGLRSAGTGLPLLFAGGALLAYAVTRALAELAASLGGRVTFVTLSARFLGRRVAFAQGWGYWASAILACMAQLTAMGVFARALWPVPAWLVAPAALLVLTGVNRLDVRLFGSIEAGLAAIKVTVLALVILLGAVALASPAMLPGAGAGRLARESLLPAGFSGLLAAVPLVLFAFGNSELIALASADLDDARHILGRTVRRFMARLALLHIGVAAALLLLIPHVDLSPAESPFVTLLARANIAGGGAIMNVVLIWVMLSSCNACLYGAARALRALADEACAPAWLAREAANGSPANAIGLSMLAVATLMGVSALASGELFALLLGAAATLGLLNWALFLLAHRRFRVAASRPAHASSAALAGIAAALLAIATPPPLRSSAATAIAAMALLALVARLRTDVTQGARGTGPAPSPPRNP